MAYETYHIHQFAEKDGTPLYPVTTSKALVGSLSSRAYNINDGELNNDWNRVIDTGFYIDNVTDDVPESNRPPSDSNTYGANCCIKVTNNRYSILQETNYPGASEKDHVVYGSSNISKNYYRLGIPTYDSVGIIESIEWNNWKEILNNSSGGSSLDYIDDGSLD